MIIRNEDLKDICNKILYAFDPTSSDIVQIKGVNNYLHMSVGNGEYFVEVKLNMYEEVDFNATINGDIFLKLISKITSDTVEFNTKDNFLIIKGDGLYKLPLIYKNDKMLEVSKINISNVINNFKINSNILNSIYQYDDKDLKKFVVDNVQTLYYLDKDGCIKFTSTAYVNSFSLPESVTLFLTKKVVKLFKLFNADDEVDFTLGKDNNNGFIVNKIMLKSDNICIMSLLPLEDSLISRIPVNFIREKAKHDYSYNILINKSIILNAINRLSLFMSPEILSNYNVIFKFNNDKIIIFDNNESNSEEIYLLDGSVSFDDKIKINILDFKSSLMNFKDDNITMSFDDKSVIVLKNNYISLIVPGIEE